MEAAEIRRDRSGAAPSTCVPSMGASTPSNFQRRLSFMPATHRSWRRKRSALCCWNSDTGPLIFVLYREVKEMFLWVWLCCLLLYTFRRESRLSGSPFPADARGIYKTSVSWMLSFLWKVFCRMGIRWWIALFFNELGHADSVMDFFVSKCVFIKDLFLLWKGGSVSSPRVPLNFEVFKNKSLCCLLESFVL